MGYFSEDEIEKALDNLNSVPDGVIDNSSYVAIFAAVYEALNNVDIEDENSRLLCMMRIINMLGDESELPSRVYEVVTSLIFHVVNLLEVGGMIHDEFSHKYMRSIREDIIPRLEEEKGVMPYWN